VLTRVLQGDVVSRGETGTEGLRTCLESHLSRELDCALEGTSFASKCSSGLVRQSRRRTVRSVRGASCRRGQCFLFVPKARRDGTEAPGSGFDPGAPLPDLCALGRCIIRENRDQTVTTYRFCVLRFIRGVSEAGEVQAGNTVSVRTVSRAGGYIDTTEKEGEETPEMMRVALHPEDETRV